MLDPLSTHSLIQACFLRLLQYGSGLDIPAALQRIPREIDIYIAEPLQPGVEVVFRLNEQQRLVLINVVGLATLATFTGLVYERTQEPLILIVGGLISVVGVLGMMTSKS
jgi:hypothetical protein